MSDYRPFSYLDTPPAPQAKYQPNLDEEFDPAKYECKTTIDLEAYARNIQNKLNEYLAQPVFPAALFDKLARRLDGLTLLVQKRYAASALSTDRKAAEDRLREYSQRLVRVPTITTPQGMRDEPSHPPKKRKLETPLEQAKASFWINDKGEEDEEQ